MTPSDDAADEVEQREVVGWLLGPADQDRAEAVEPGMRTLDHPTSRLGPGVTLGPDLFTPAAQVEREAELFGQCTWLVVVKAFVETEMLGTVACWPGATHWDRRQGPAHQLMVVAVGAVDHRAERHAARIGQQRAFDPALASVGGIGAGFFPHPAVPSPSPRPAPTNATQSPSGRHRPADPRARTPRTRQPPPTPGSAGAPRKTSRCRSPSAHSIGILCEARRRSHPSPHGPARADCDTPRDGLAALAAGAASSPTAHPAGANRHPEYAVPVSSTHPSLSCHRY